MADELQVLRDPERDRDERESRARSLEQRRERALAEGLRAELESPDLERDLAVDPSIAPYLKDGSENESLEQKLEALGRRDIEAGLRAKMYAAGEEEADAQRLLRARGRIF